MILLVAIPSPLRRLFDYLPPENGAADGHRLLPGIRVKVPFGNRKVVGLVIGTSAGSEQPPDKLKRAEAVLDREPVVPPRLLDLLVWAADYYQHPVGDALFSALPALLRKGAPLPGFETEYWQLSAQGKGLGDHSLKGARKQQGLIRLLRDRGEQSASEVIGRGFSRQIFRSLEQKGLVESIRRETGNTASGPLLANPPLTLRDEQAAAVRDITPGCYSTTLLFGDTGSGKTEVYLQSIEKVLRKGKQALVLVPEINLTPQLIDRFRRRFHCEILALHSRLTDRERLRAWSSARAGRARIIIGTRSAVFTPMPGLGIIIIDEEHDASLKQQEGFRYSARDVAVMRASRAKVPVILGSATPSLESLHNCRIGRYQLRELRQRRHDIPPAWKLVDLKGTRLQGGLAGATIEAVNEHLDRGNQVLVFLNRRGYAPAMLCHDCGWQASCMHCSTGMTAHLGANRLICHHCEHQVRLPSSCPGCGGTHLWFSGQGTERCEETLNQLFPGFPVVRVDRDSTRKKGAMDRAIEHIKTNQPCILLGTQMLAKGHHFPAVTLAVLLDVDGGLFSTDFRAIERTAQLIIQVAGRAGRGERPGEIYLQSHHCEHPVIRDLVNGDYRALADRLLSERELLGLPPFTHLVCFRCDARHPEEAEKFLRGVRVLAETLMPAGRQFNYLGPLPGAIEKRRGLYRFTLLIHAVNRRRLTAGLTALCTRAEALKSPAGLRWSVDVDPQEMS